MATAYCALVHRKTTGCGDDFPCSRRFLHAHAWRYASVSNGCQEGTLRDGVVPQKTLLSFPDVPKMQTLTPLKSQKTEGYSPKNSPAIFIRGGELRLMRYCWRTQKCRNVCIPHAFFEGRKAEETSPRKSTLRPLKLGRLRARSFRPFLPAPRRTGLDTCRIIRLSGFLVSLTWAY